MRRSFVLSWVFGMAMLPSMVTLTWGMVTIMIILIDVGEVGMGPGHGDSHGRRKGILLECGYNCIALHKHEHEHERKGTLETKHVGSQYSHLYHAPIAHHKLE